MFITLSQCNKSGGQIMMSTDKLAYFTLSNTRPTSKKRNTVH